MGMWIKLAPPITVLLLSVVLLLLGDHSALFS